MAIEVIVLVLNAKFEDKNDKYVMLGMANHAHPDGTKCYPSVKRIAIYTGLGESTIRSKLKNLRNQEIIRIEAPSSHHRPTEYSINLQLLKEMEDPRLAELDAWRKHPPYMGVSDLQQPEVLSESITFEPNPDLRISQTDLQMPANRPLRARGNPLKEPLSKPTEKISRPDGRGPAVELFRRINHRYPPKKLYGLIDRTVGEDFSSLLRWGRTIRDWISSGYNPTNYRGMLNVFSKGWNHKGRPDDHRRVANSWIGAMEGEEVGEDGLTAEERREKYTKGWFDE